MDFDFGQSLTPEPEEISSFEGIIDHSRVEHEQIRKELKEIGILIQQSSSEVEKLAQRNAQMTNKVRGMENQLESQPRDYIQETYKAAQDTQGRLFMMRGQVEQLQSRQQHLQRYANHLKNILEAYDQSNLNTNSPQTKQNKASNGTSGDLSHADNTIVEIINAQESERQLLSQQLHDGTAQSLTNLILQAEICERLFDKDQARARDELSNLKESVNATFQKVRSYIFDLRPMMLDDLGLVPTLKQYVREFEGKSNLHCTLEITGTQERMPAHIEVTLFRVIQALLSNVSMHANATNIQIQLDQQAERITAKVEDDGSGFDISDVNNSPKMGIRSMRKRIAMLGGEINFDSNIGRGTSASIWLPIE